MELKVVSVKDLAVDAFMRPFFVPHIGLALRSFEDEVNRPDSDMFKHAKDYVLYEIGSFSEDTGSFKNLEQPKMLVRAVDIFEARKVKSNGSG